MESFYSYSNFLRILVALGALCFLVPRLVLKASSHHERLLYVSVITLIVIQALAPIVPYPEIRRISPVFLWLSIPCSAALILSLIGGTERPVLLRHQDRIIDTLRESVLVFDRQFNLIEQSGILSGLESGQLAGLVKEMKTHIDSAPFSETPSEGLFLSGNKTYRYRFQPVSRGHLLTLLDMTEEQKLLDEVMEKNRLLQRRYALLESSETLELQTRREKYRVELSSRILEMVRIKLREIESLLTETVEIETVLKCTGEAMTEIRREVSRLAREEGAQ
ncbi:MAG: hypothetical protein JXR86_11445 [Spirochaetales bacterium]|nr:hypothetical protein [Spirochaetales bacterium]